jgi:pyrroline-5-carboxylate reductase
MPDSGMGKITFIGPGMMAEALVSGLRQTGGVPAGKMMLAGPRQELKKRHGVEASTDSRAAVAGAEVVVLSIRPQSLPSVLEQLADGIPPASLVLSIVVGTRLQTIVDGLGHASVVRAMPNTPAQIGQGITVWTATTSCSAAQRARAEQMLGALGQQVFVEDEDYLDMATAVSGTGPAYVYLFMEAMVDAGVHLGFPRRIAEQLVVQTLKGSVAFCEYSPGHLARLRNQVTSPAGTSAAALYYLEKAGFRTAISRAIWAAYERSVELGRGRKRGPVRDT